LTATYMVVLFSIIVQGLSVAALARRVGREPEMI
jgi:CPA1 family monovalent cation:H+ antiporter